MTIEQARYIIEVARCGSFFKAAQNLYVSQSAVSQAISSFEEELGMPVFVRKHTGSTPTPVGTDIVKYCTFIIHGCNSIDEIREGHRHKEENVPFFTMNVGSLKFLTHVFEEFNREFPFVVIDHKCCSYLQTVFALQHNACNLALFLVDAALLSKLGGLFDIQIIAELNMCLYANKDHPLAKVKCLSPDMKIEEPLRWVGLDQSFGKAYQNRIPEFMESDVLFYSNDIPLLLHAVNDRKALLPFPDFPIPLGIENVYSGGKNICRIPIRFNNVSFPCFLVLAMRTGVPLSITETCIFEFCRKSAIYFNLG